MNLPSAFTKNILTVFDDGKAWLSHLPAAIKATEKQWDIRVLAHYPNLSYNFVAPVLRQDGTRAVLKLGIPRDELASEIQALRAWKGRGAVKLLAGEPEKGALLLEMLEPGRSFWDSHDDILACQTCAKLLKQLWSAQTDLQSYRNLESWSQELLSYANSYTKTSSPIPYALVDKARGLRQELLQETEQVLLHGDLHHDNMLSASRQAYLAIDPKGIAGPRGYDVGPFLMNPDKRNGGYIAKNVTELRLELFSEILELPKTYLAAWGLVHCLLSLCWDLHEGKFPQQPLAVAEQLEAFC